MPSYSLIWFQNHGCFWFEPFTFMFSIRYTSLHLSIAREDRSPDYLFCCPELAKKGTCSLSIFYTMLPNSPATVTGIDIQTAPEKPAHRRTRVTLAGL